MRIPHRGLVALCCLGALPAPLVAQDRLVQRLTAVGAVQLGSVRSLAEDSLGYLWIGTVSGLLRWDGQALRRWAPDQLDTWVNELAVCADGRLYAALTLKGVFEIDGQGAHPLERPGALTDPDAGSVSCDVSGQLWVTGDTRVWRRDSAGRWLETPLERPEGRHPFFVRGTAGSGPWLRAGGALWSLATDGSARMIADGIRPVAGVVGPTGDTLLLTGTLGVYRLAGGRPERILAPPGRGIDMVRRGRTVWAAFDRYLVGITPDRDPEVIGPKDLPEGAGPVLVDHEGSLWAGSFSGLLHFPEPETRIWHDRDGLPSAHTRFAARAGSRVWVATWQGLGFVEDRGGRFVADTAPAGWSSGSPPFLDRSGILWLSSASGLLEVRDQRVIHARPFGVGHWQAMDAPGGGIWLGSERGLLHAPPGSSRVEPVAGTPFSPGSPVRRMLRARDGRLWLSGEDRVCHGAAPAPTPAETSWSCDSIPEAGELTGLVETEHSVWVSSSRIGVLRLGESGWEAHPGNRSLQSRAVYGLRPSAAGGIWILGFLPPVRVVDRPDDPLGWEVVESLTAWQGTTSDAQDLFEDPDGTIWIATSLGLVRVPASARKARPVAPRIAVVEASVDGVPVTTEAGVALRHRQHRLAVRFAALSYRDPTRLRYQVRLAPREDWTDRTGSPVFSWIDLPAGRYRVEARASVDGESWSASPAGFSVVVNAPWYLRGWVIAGALLGLAGAAYLGYRVRVAILLRLERQRTRIALDLHDEIGAGLGSIGILSGALTNPGTSEEERSTLARTIGQTTSELAAAVADIVWSLRPKEATVEDVVTRLVEHGVRFFAGDGAIFEVERPERLPRARLSPAVSRAVLLIGVEALHNAARHSAAAHVWLRADGTAREMLVAIEDDGRGFPPDAETEGLGLTSMRRRAEEIGGSLAWTPRPGGGARVSLRIPIR